VESQRRSKEELDQLVAAARGGSSERLDRLVEVLSECLWAEFANRRKLQLLSPSRGPSDLIQDTLICVRLKFGDFQEETFGAFSRWARGIFFNRSREVGRNSRCRNAPERRESIRRAIKQRIGSNANGSSPTDLMAEQEEAARAYQLYGELKVNERTIINLRLFEGMSFVEIAKLTELKPDAARKSFDRAMLGLTESFLSDGQRRSS
jgi:RNA polymerase sigma factor (sigma-70 family)